MLQHAACLPSTLLHLHPLIPRRPHLALRTRVRARRQKLINHRQMPIPRSPMQRRETSLRRAAVLRQAHPRTPRKCVRPLPNPRSCVLTNLERGKEEMEQDNSPAAKP